MAIFRPWAEAAFMEAIPLYQYLDAPPVCMDLGAMLMNESSGWSIKGGQYRPESGTIAAIGVPKDEDISLENGAAEGIVFQGSVTNASGSSSEGWRDHTFQGQRRVLEQPDGGANVSCRLLEKQFYNIANRNVEIRLVIGAIHESLTPTSDNYYTFIRLLNSTNFDIRIAMVYGRPISLEHTIDAPIGAGGDDDRYWTPVAVASDIGNLETYLAQNDRSITLVIEYDRALEKFTVQIGQKAKPLVYARKVERKVKDTRGLKVTPSDTSLTYDNPIGTNHRLYLSAMNGYRKFSMRTLEYGEMEITGPSIPFPNRTKQPLGVPSGGYPLRNDDQKMEFTPDFGDGFLKPYMKIKGVQGQTSPEIKQIMPVISGTTVILPADWSTTSGGRPNYSVGYLPVMRVEEVQTFDLNTRLGSTEMKIHCLNRDRAYTGIYGQPAIRVAGNNGGATVTRLTGIVGGMSGGITFRDRYFSVDAYDRLKVMDVPMMQSVVFDGWHISSALRYLCELGNIHPSFINFGFDSYTPPHGRSDAPYGQAGYDATGYILGRGTGRQPKYEYQPNMSVIGTILELIRDLSDLEPATQSPVPWMMYFSPDGRINIGPYSLYRQPIAAHYYKGNLGYDFMEQPQVFRSMRDMRTSVVFQGYDPIRGDLLHAWYQQPQDVIRLVGYNNPWLERNVRFVSEEYILWAIQAAAFRARIPTTYIRMKVPFQPHIFAGSKIQVTDYDVLDANGVAGTFMIERLENVWGRAEGSGKSYCESTITARNIESLM